MRSQLLPSPAHLPEVRPPNPRATVLRRVLLVALVLAAAATVWVSARPSATGYPGLALQQIDPPAG